MKKYNILILGSSQGIGRSLAAELFQYSNGLVMLSKTIDKLEEIKKQLSESCINIHTKYCDASNKESVLEGISFARQQLGTIDYAIYNAGVGWPEPFINFNSDNIKGVFDVNLFGLSYFFEGIIPVLKEQGYGTIAGVSSLADRRGYPGSASYCSSKAAASIFMESARVELRSLNIKVITIKPGFVKTAMTDKNKFYMPFLMKPEKAVKIIRKGLFRGKRIIQFPIGTVLLIKLSNHLPNFIYDRMIISTKENVKIKA